MTTVLRVYLSKAEYLRISERTPILLLQSVQILYLLGRESQTFLFVVLLQIIHILYWLRLDVDSEDFLIQSSVHTLQHLVVLSVLGCGREILLNTAYALETHILRYLNSIGRPRGHHLTARTNVESV